MLNSTRKNLSNLVLNFVTYLWDTTLEVVLKPLLIQLQFEEPSAFDAEKAELFFNFPINIE